MEEQLQSNAACSSEQRVAILLDTIQQLVRELRPYAEEEVSVSLDQSLDRELGLDSLGRMELVTRLEAAFGVHFPEQVLATAESPRDLLRALQPLTGRVDRGVGEGPVHQALASLVAIPTEAQTLIEVLAWHAERHPQRLHLSLYGAHGIEAEVTYGALYARAQEVAAALRQRDLQPQQAVALMLPTGREFFESFYGILLAGGIPVPIYPPGRPSQLEDHLRRQVGILSNAQTSLLITVPEAQSLARLLRPQVESLRYIVTAEALKGGAPLEGLPQVRAEDTALLQYTSGSTGQPKGVVLTHANLLANIRAMAQAARASAQDVFVSWLPLYHDMGLIGAWMGSLYQAFHLVLMSPLTFLARPERWLWAIHQHRGTISGGPNFAYALCTRRLDDRVLEGLDLRSWRLAFNGAESVSLETMERFCERFAAYGFRREAMTPVYGLAEGTLDLAFPPPGRGPRVDHVKRDPFTRTGQAIPADPHDTDALAFVSCGYPLPGHQIRIVDVTGFEVAERQEGRLEFCGPSVTRGYFRNPEATRALFHDAWADSGDLAYIAEGEVYITGRAKDVIIRAGRHVHPQEVEEVIGNLEGVRKGCVAVFGSTDPESGTERLVVMAETRNRDSQTLAALRQKIDAVAVDLLGMPADDVVLVPPQTVLKTSSGKIRRAASRARYEQGEIGGRGVAVWRQILRFAIAGMRPQLRRSWRGLVALLYAGYVWMVFALLITMAWIALALIPKRSWCQSLMRRVARLILRLGGLTVQVQGLDHLPDSQASVLVVNHASYLDAVVLMSQLPLGLVYVAKRELGERFVSWLLFKRLGVAFVERFDTQRGLEDTARIRTLVQAGTSVVFFPEGTFGREPGLRPFRMGAFMVAAQAGVAVVPVAIRGTRSILRAGQWLLRRGVMRLTIGAALVPHGRDWNAAVQLRDQAYEAILQTCGEPALVNPADPGAFADMV